MTDRRSFISMVVSALAAMFGPVWSILEWLNRPTSKPQVAGRTVDIVAFVQPPHVFLPSTGRVEVNIRSPASHISFSAMGRRGEHVRAPYPFDPSSPMLLRVPEREAESLLSGSRMGWITHLRADSPLIVGPIEALAVRYVRSVDFDEHRCELRYEQGVFYIVDDRMYDSEEDQVKQIVRDHRSIDG